MQDHNCAENVWWLESKIAKEGDVHGKVVVRGACSICDCEVYAVGKAGDLDTKSQEELSEEEEKVISTSEKYPV